MIAVAAVGICAESIVTESIVAKRIIAVIVSFRFYASEGIIAKGVVAVFVIAIFIVTVFRIKGIALLRLSKGRCLQNNIHRRSTAQRGVDNFHALIDFGVAAEIIDKAIFHFEAANADHGKRTEAQSNQNNPAAMTLGKVGKYGGNRGRVIGYPGIFAFAQQHHAGGDNNKRDHQSQ